MLLYLETASTGSPRQACRDQWLNSNPQLIVGVHSDTLGHRCVLLNGPMDRHGLVGSFNGLTMSAILDVQTLSTTKQNLQKTRWLTAEAATQAQQPNTWKVFKQTSQKITLITALMLQIAPLSLRGGGYCMENLSKSFLRIAQHHWLMVDSGT